MLLYERRDRECSGLVNPDAGNGHALDKKKGRYDKSEVSVSPMRKGESEVPPRFRKSRFFHSMDEWYFITREETVEGPFAHKAEAERMLEAYISSLSEPVH